ncbi:hypothetical protein [Lusitaniella coriacea]|uniref:hypothetical protein n=1 Tax=Lusitaniella coriacea TaxID=1983105 RepID=UPI003CED17D9
MERERPISLTCPVCNRPEIEGNRCPNCETDLSSVRMLIELPPVRQGISPWWLAIATIVGAIAGFSRFS